VSTFFYKICVMKKLTIIVFSLICFAWSTSLNAQTIYDAVRYSNLNYTGTARTAGAGFSFGAMGGDFGVASINPAGIADFRKSELMFSLSVTASDNNAKLSQDPNSLNDGSTRLFFDNIGVVFNGSPRRGKFATSNISIGLNQLASYNESFRYEGTSTGSITDRFLELARFNTIDNGVMNPDFLDNFESGLAYETGAIYGDSGDYFSDFIATDNVTKRQEINRSGKMNELSFAWAGNYDNKFGVGLAIGVPFITFEENKAYTETDPANEIPFFESLDFNETLATSGTGINFKLGLNTTVARIIRLGAAYHSPTWFSLEDNYFTSLRYAYTDAEGTFNTLRESPDGRFEYSLVTPMKFVGSVGALLKVSEIKGFVNADFEYRPYTSNKFNLGDDSGEQSFENELNAEIDSSLQDSYNIKLGAEVAYKKMRVRSGVNLLASPFADAEFAGVSNIITLGLGYRGDRFFIDGAFIMDNSTEEYNPYKLADSSQNQLVVNDAERAKFLMTMGFKF